MNRVYKNIQEFLILNFPDSYNKLKETEKFDIQFYIEKTSDAFGEKIASIINKLPNGT
ncbi:MAG: hypothetical protein LBP20_10275 [Treponema sp.]|nr:hypothetical protein [Treponema sp.]